MLIEMQMRTRQPFIWAIRGIGRISMVRPIQIKTSKHNYLATASLVFQARTLSVASLNRQNEFFPPILRKQDVLVIHRRLH